MSIQVAYGGEKVNGFKLLFQTMSKGSHLSPRQMLPAAQNQVVLVLSERMMPNQLVNPHVDIGLVMNVEKP